MRPPAPSRLLVLLAALSVVLAGCARGGATIPSTSGPVTPPAHPALPTDLAVVDPSLVTGLTSEVQENLKRGQYTYLSYPSMPGARPWIEEIKSELAPKIARFKELSGKPHTPPYPELSLNWDLIAASPQAMGVRLVTTELGDDDTLEGTVQTSWWDPANREPHGPDALIREAAYADFFDRLTAAAEADSRVDMQLFHEQLGGEWEGIRSVAFTTTGGLWVEFSRRQVSGEGAPLGIAVDPTGLLSNFGELARTAALTPSDPAGGTGASASSPSASATPSTSATATTTPSTSASPSASKSPRPSKAASSPTVMAPTGKQPNCAKLKCVALTFDDGPVAGTARLLDTLKAKGVHATFFTVGYNAATHPGLLRRMVAEGHIIGNHTYSHQQLTRLSASAVRSEIARTNTLVEKATGVTPTLLRPPYGATSSTVRKVAGSLGMSQILWNVDPLDWKDHNSALVTRRVLAAARPGSIILSHDIHPTTVQAYPAIIDGLRAKGFTIVTVPELLGSRLTPGASFRGR